MVTLPFVYFSSHKSPQIRIIRRTKAPSSFFLYVAATREFFEFLLKFVGNFLNIQGASFWDADKEDSQAEEAVPSQEMACFPAEEAVISVSRLINPWVSCYCTLPAIWSSRQNPAGHSSTQYALPDTLKAVGCLPVERQILHVKVGLKHPWAELELKGHFTQFAKQQTPGDV